ncbi:MAG TPA: AAA family ATPase [archaeon]|nr:AAA family ATPase [archaeon]
MKFVLGLTGFASSGKSTVANYLRNKYGFQFLVFSDVIVEEAKSRGLWKAAGLESQKMILSQVGDMMRVESGDKGIIAKKLVDLLSASKHDKHVIDGFRTPAEVELFRKSFAKFYLLHIMAGDDMRFKRRQAEDPTASFEKMKERDSMQQIMDTIRTVNFRINNNGTREELYRQVDSILDTVR